MRRLWLFQVIIYLKNKKYKVINIAKYTDKNYNCYELIDYLKSIVNSYDNFNDKKDFESYMNILDNPPPPTPLHKKNLE